MTWLLLSVALSASPTPVEAVPSKLRERLNLSAHYAKTVDVRGFPIVASSKVADAALREAGFIVTSMLVNHPEDLKALASQNLRLAVMAPTELTTDLPEHSDLVPKDYWNRRARGLGATVARPAVSCAEENLLEEPGDPYFSECICLHEFAHTLAEFAIPRRMADFKPRLSAAFENAKKRGTWKGTYAATNEAEYWAEAVQSWFDTNRHDDAEHGTIDTREEVQKEDPQIAALIRDAFGEVTWRYVRPSRRTEEERAMLGPWPSPVPTFRWPETQAPVASKNEAFALQSMATLPSKSPGGNSAVRFTLKNDGTAPVDVEWLSFEGKRTRYSTVPPGGAYEQPTYVGHVWVVVRHGEAIGWFATPQVTSVINVR